MKMTLTRPNVTTRQIVMATLLLLGILIIAYGWFLPSRIGLYVGLLVTAAGVLDGVLQILVHGRK